LEALKMLKKYLMVSKANLHPNCP